MEKTVYGRLSSLLFVACFILLAMLFMGRADIMDPDIFILIILLTGFGSFVMGCKYLYCHCMTKKRSDATEETA